MEGLGCGAGGLKFVLKLQTTSNNFLIANGQRIEARFPCSLEAFLIAQKLLPRSVVVELNGEAVAPSEFSQKQLQSGDRLEVVNIVAGG